MLRAILFDFNGVLIDDEPLHLELFQKVLEEEGITLAAADYYAHYLGCDDRGCFTAVFERAGRPVSAEHLSRLIARKAAYYQARVLSAGYPVFPGAVELVREAAEAGIMLGVVSGALRDEVEGALEELGVRRLFKVLVTAEDVAEGKPDPEGFRRGLERLNAEPPLPSRLVHPHEVVAVEDSPAGLQAAAAVGLTTLGVAHTYPAGELSLADQVVASLAGLGLGRIRTLLAAESA